MKLLTCNLILRINEKIMNVQSLMAYEHEMVAVNRSLNTILTLLSMLNIVELSS